MPCNLARDTPTTWPVPKGHTADLDRLSSLSADTVRRQRIVIACDPDPLKAGRKLFQSTSIVLLETTAGLAVMKSVTQADDPLGRKAQQDLGQAIEG